MIEKMHFRNQIRRRLGTMKRRTANRGVLSIGLVSLLVGLGGETLSWGADPAGAPENTSQISFPLGIESARSVLERVRRVEFVEMVWALPRRRARAGDGVVSSGHRSL